MSTKYLGDKGEILAREYLVRHGYTVVDHNFRSRYGEIDLIARKKKAYRTFQMLQTWGRSD